MNTPSTTFGPTALATPANAVTLLRLLATPLFLALILDRGPSWWAVGAWVVLAGTDGVDGWVARRHGTTRSGAFLDPLADKFLVLGALVALVINEELWWVPVALIAVREVWMSVYRTWASRRGISMPARLWAKVKTLGQDLAVLLAVMPVVADHHRGVVDWVLWVAVVLTLATGVQYAADGRRLSSAAKTDHRLVKGHHS
ncbi:MAG: CDP-alcohol phosphatidyltransferase family protein [Acidimicrobiales bacterium]